MMSHGAQVLQSLGSPAVNTAPGGSAVPCRAIVNDADKEIRLTRTTDLASSDATASVAASLSPRRGGRLTCAGSEYEITGLVRSSTPGLIDLGLVRISGAGIDTYDVGPAVLAAMGEEIIIDGREIRAAVNRSGLLVEEDKWGNKIEMIRNVLGVRLVDAAGISPGSIATFDGRDHLVLRILRDGTGMVRIVC